MLLYRIFFFFQQKTAYELRISDWSSDVCSSDLFFAENAGLLLWIGVLLVAAPAIDSIHVMLTNQAVVPAFTSLIRWQNHRYVLRQSLSFYQNDFAGRIANKVKIGRAHV